MDVIDKLGILALATRLKRLSDRLLRDASHIYQDRQLDFEARWFTILYTLSLNSPQSVTTCAQSLGLTHPAVNQVAGSLLERGLISAVHDKSDERKRLLSLTNKGRDLLSQLEPVLADIKAATGEILAAADGNLLKDLAAIEKSINDASVYDRVTRSVKQRQFAAVEIVDYKPAYKNFFKMLNYEWLEEHFVVEDIDERMLSDPNRYILKQGGEIIFARLDSEIVATAALLQLDDTNYELAKMAVTESARGRQIGLRLTCAVIERARSRSAERLYLATSPKLVPAINLYEKLGFQQTNSAPLGRTVYRRHTIIMQLDIHKYRESDIAKGTRYEKK